MERDNQQLSDRIDLGAASEETKGALGAGQDEINFRAETGLDDD